MRNRLGEGGWNRLWVGESDQRNATSNGRDGLNQQSINDQRPLFSPDPSKGIEIDKESTIDGTMHKLWL